MSGHGLRRKALNRSHHLGEQQVRLVGKHRKGDVEIGRNFEAGCVLHFVLLLLGDIAAMHGKIDHRYVGQHQFLQLVARDRPRLERRHSIRRPETFRNHQALRMHREHVRQQGRAATSGANDKSFHLRPQRPSVYVIDQSIRPSKVNVIADPSSCLNGYLFAQRYPRVH